MGTYDDILGIAPQEEKPQSKSVFLPAIARSGAGMVKGFGHVASALGADQLGQGLQAFGTGVEKQYPAQYRLKDIGDHPGGFVVETLGEVIPTALGMAIPGGVAGKLATRFAPGFAEKTFLNTGAKLLPGATGKQLAVGAGVGAGSSLLESGEILGQQMEETGRYDPVRAFGYGTAAGALDVPFGIGGVITKGLAGQLGKTAAKEVGLSAIPKQMLKVGAQEAGQEGVQTALEMQGTQEGGFAKKAGTEAGVEDLLTSMVKGFIGGGAFGGAHGGAQYLEAKNQEQKKTLEAETREALRKSTEEQQQAVTQETAARAARQQEAGDLFPDAGPPGPPAPTVQETAQQATPDTQTRDWVDEQAATQETARRARMQQLAAEAEQVNSRYLTPEEEHLQAADEALAKMRGVQEGRAAEAKLKQDAESRRARVARVLELERALEDTQGGLRMTPEMSRKVALDLSKQPSLDAVVGRAAELAADPQYATAAPFLQKFTELLQRHMAEQQVAPVEEALTKPKEAAQGAVKKPESPVNAQEKPSEPTSEVAPAQAPAQEATGSGPANTGKTGAETEPVAPSKTAGNGASTTEKGLNDGLQTKAQGNAKTAETQVKEAKNAVQKPSAKEVPVQSAPGHSEAVGKGVSPTREAAAKARNAPAEEKVSKEERTRREGSQDYPEYWMKQLRGKATEQGKESESATALGTIIRLLTDPKTSKISFKGIEGAKVNHALYALASEAEAIGVPHDRLSKVHIASQDFLTYVTNAGETWAKKVAAARKQLEEGEAAREEEDQAKKNTEESRLKESRMAKEGKLGAEQKEAGAVKITLYDKAGVEHVFDNKKEADAFRKAQEKTTSKKVAEDLAGEETQDTDSVSTRAQAMADALFPGRESYHRTIHPMPNQTEYDAVVKQGDVVGVVGLIKQHFKDNAALKSVFAWVEKNVGDVKLKYVDEEMTDDYGHYVGGMYDAATHTVEVYRGGSNPVVLAHELVHAAMERELQTVESYIRNKASRSELMERKVKAYNDLKKQYEAYLTTMPDSKEYGLTNLSEFLAEVFSNPDFRAALQTQPKVNLWQRVLRAIARLIGVDHLGLNDLFQAAQILAYRDPAAVYMPAEMRRVYNVQEAMSGVREKLDDLPKVKTWMSKAGETALGEMYKMSSVHNIVELWKDKFTGLADYWSASQSTRTLSTLLNNITGLRAEQQHAWMEQDKRRTHRAMNIALEQSMLRLTEDDVIDLAKGKMTFDALLKKRYGKEGNNLRDTVDMRERVNELAKLARQEKWGEMVRRSTNALPKDSAEWTTQEFVASLFDQNRKSAKQMYDIALRNLYYHYAPDKQDALKVFNIGGDKVDETAFTQNSERVKEMLGKLQVSPDQASRLQQQMNTLDKLQQNAETFSYMHVTRQGDFFISIVKKGEGASNPDEVIGFSRFETEAEMRAARAEMQADGGSVQLKDNGWVLESGKIKDFTSSKAVEGMRQLAESVQASISGLSDIEPEQALLVKDAINQALFNLMPETSALKSFIHRKGTPGWDAAEQFNGHLRQLLTSNFHYANNRYLAEREFHLDSMRKEVRDEEQKNSDKGVQMHRVLQELVKRHSLSFVEMETPVLDWARSFVYHWQLAWSPAYLMVNMLQPYMITIPTLGAKYGFTRSAKALMNGYTVGAKVLKAMASHGFLKNVSHEEIVATLKSAGLDADELAAVRHMLDSGKVEFSLAKEAGMLSEGRGVKAAKVSKFLSLGSHYTEVLNRIATGVAAYEMEMERQKKGAGYEHEKALRQAEKTALWAIDETQVYYDQINMPRAMGKHGYLGKATPLFTTFMFFNVNLLEKYIRHMRTMLNATEATEEERKEAWRAFTGMMLTTASVAGTMGLPMASLIMLALGVAGGDKDEPFDAETSWRAWLAETFGVSGGLGVAHGLPAMFGVDLYSRAGQHDVLPFTRFFTDHRSISEMPAQDLMKALSPTLSTAVSMWGAPGKAYDWIANGDMAAGDAFVRAMPAAVRGAATTMRGYYDVSGNDLGVENTATQNALQMLGITPVWRNEQYFQITSMKNKDTQLARRAAYIKKNWAHSLDEGDTAEAADWQEQWTTFLGKNPEFGRTGGIGQLLRKMNKDRAFYKMTGMGVAVPPSKFEEAFGLSQYLALPEHGEDDE